ncbi:unnamed protein product [Closterium sp. NIES-54]
MARINESTNQRIELDDRVSISADFPAGSAISPATQARRRFIEDKGAGDNVAAERAEMLARVLAPSGDYLPRIKLGAAGGAEEASAGWLGAEGATRANTTQPIRRAQRRTVTPSSSSSSSSPLSVASATTFVAACVVAAGAAFARHKSSLPEQANISCVLRPQTPPASQPRLCTPLSQSMPCSFRFLTPPPPPLRLHPPFSRFQSLSLSPASFSPASRHLALPLLIPPMQRWWHPPVCQSRTRSVRCTRMPTLPSHTPHASHAPHTFHEPLTLIHPFPSIPSALRFSYLSALTRSLPSPSFSTLFLTRTPLPHSHPSSSLSPLFRTHPSLTLTILPDSLPAGQFLLSLSPHLPSHYPVE